MRVIFFKYTLIYLRLNINYEVFRGLIIKLYDHFNNYNNAFDTDIVLKQKYVPLLLQIRLLDCVRTAHIIGIKQ